MDDNQQSATGVSSPCEGITATTAVQPTLAEKLNIAMRGEPVSDNFHDDATYLAELVASRVPELRAYALGSCRAHNVSYCKSLAITLLLMAYVVVDVEAVASWDASHEFHEQKALPRS